MASITMQSSASAVDGRVQRGGVNEDWATLIAGAGTAVSYTPTTGYSMIFTAHTTTNEWTTNSRMVFLFDPASLPTGAVITGGTLQLYCNTISANNFGSSFVLTNAPVTAYTSLITADYNRLHLQKVEHGTARVTVASLSAGSYFTFTLNSTALTTFQSLYDSGNVFELGLMYDWDFDETSPTWSSGLSDDITIMTVEAGSTKWPILSIEYYVGTGNATLEIVGQKASAGDTLNATLLAVEVYT